ncbi:MAG: ATP-binding cassette domain-containing protein [Pseudomonadota bacterium]
MLVLEKISKVFNPGSPDEKMALDAVDLEVEQGDFITIIGSNGAGKTTLLNIITGTVFPDSGRVSICRRDVTGFKEHARACYLARVFQNPSLGTAADMTIEENLCLAELRGQRRRLTWGITGNRRARYREVLKALDLGLENRLEEKVGLLSGGQRQSLSLLMTTLVPPSVLLLDEHTAALDPKTAEKVMNLTEMMVGRRQLTTLMVTHNMNQAIKHGNRMIMLHQGRIQLDLSGEDKSNLTVSQVIDKFGRALKDETLFSREEK